MLLSPAPTVGVSSQCRKKGSVLESCTPASHQLPELVLHSAEQDFCLKAVQTLGCLKWHPLLLIYLGLFFTTVIKTFQLVTGVTE